MLPLRSFGAHNAKLYGISNRADFKREGAYRKSRDEVPEILNMDRSEIQFTSSSDDYVALCKDMDSLHIVTRIGGINCYTMMDSGSTVSLLSINSFRKMRSVNSYPTKQSLAMASGNFSLKQN